MHRSVIYSELRLEETIAIINLLFPSVYIVSIFNKKTSSSFVLNNSLKIYENTIFYYFLRSLKLKATIYDFS